MLRSVALGLFLVALGASTADATPFTWQYDGAVVSSFAPNLVPVGTPATIRLTVDPSQNLVAGLCSTHPEAGVYSFQTAITYGGQTFTAGGFFQLNVDPNLCVPQPGIHQEQFVANNNGPSLSGGIPFAASYTPSGFMLDNGVPCAANPQIGGARCESNVIGHPLALNPLLPTFPGFDVYGFTMLFAGADCQFASSLQCAPAGSITVVGTAVPEPTTVLLVGGGLTVLYRRRRG